MESLHGGFSERGAVRAPPVFSVLVSMQDLGLRYTWIRDPGDALREEDVVGKTDEDLFGPEDAALLVAIKRDVLATGRPQRLKLWLTFRSTRRWFDLGVHPERNADGSIVGVLCTAVDITAQKRSAQVLRQRAQRLALLYEAAAGLLATNDPMRFLEQLFVKLSALFDLDVYAHYAVASDGTHLRLAASGGLPPSQRHAMARLEFGQPPCGAVAATRRSIILSDSTSTSDPIASALRSLGLRAYVCHPLIAGGELFGTLAFGSSTEAEHTQESVGLFRAVSDLFALAIARQRAAQSLRDADRRKDLFLATLAHELRNPLAPLRSGIDLLQAATHDPETIAVTLAVMDRQVTQLTRLVDDLLEVSRITQGRLELRKCRVQLAAIVESALEQTRALFDEAGHELTIDLPEETIELDADPVRLAQVLANLLSNAAKYTPSGGHVRLGADASGADIAITVSDDGIGIPAENLKRVFEMFERVDGYLERSTKGLGLGLTLVKSLVEMHGGTVEAHSGGLGRGSSFTIRVPTVPRALREAAPCGEAEAEASTTSAAGAERSLAVGDAARSRRVLIVDDNVDAANMLGRLVTLLGHEICVALDGPKALEAMPTFHPDIVLLDIGMPGMNGYDVAQRIRERGPVQPVLVALTGWGQAKDKQRAAEAGFDHYLVKPVERTALQKLLEDGAPARSPTV
ncbi:MAG TPA: ATP-binding protein [Gammaproteobacteria bacterium]